MHDGHPKLHLENRAYTVKECREQRPVARVGTHHDWNSRIVHLRQSRNRMRLTVATLGLLAILMPGTGAGQGKPSNGADLVGTKLPGWTAGPEWANSKPLRLRDLRGRVVMVRFWTDTCDYCAASLPAMQKLADEFREQEVTFVGLYHSKPLGSERPWKTVVARANALGVKFPIAYDHSWKTLSVWWLDGRRRPATSASFVIARDGTVAHVHPGPVFYPSDDATDARANTGYEAIRDAIRDAIRNGR